MTVYLIIAFTVAQALPLRGGEIDHQAIQCFKDANAVTTTDAKVANDAAAAGGVVFALNASKKGVAVALLKPETSTAIRVTPVEKSKAPAKK